MDEIEGAEVGRHFDGLDSLNQFLLASAELDQGGDCSNLEAVFFGKFGELGKTGHSAVGVENLANDSGRLLVGEAGKIDRCFGVTGSAKNAFLHRL